MKLLNDSYRAYVNLDARPERDAKMKAELARVGLTAARHRGLLPAEFAGMEHLYPAMHKRPQRGAIGCYFAQVGVMREAMRQAKHAWVMEDDLVFCDDFQDRLAIIDAFTQQVEWDVIWLGGTFHVNPPHWHVKTLKKDAERTWHHPRILRTYGAFCTYAYIVNQASLSKVLGKLDTVLERSIGIDHSFILIQPELQAFAFVPGSVIQYDHRSDIGLGITEFSKFNRLGPYWFAKRMTDFDPEQFDWKEARL